MSILFRHAPTVGVEKRSTVTLPGYALRLFQDAWPSMSTTVDGDSSMRHDAVWSCRTQIAQDVSMMPVDVVRYVSGRRQPVDQVPQIIAAPSVMMSDPMDWRYQVIDSWLGWGNAWGTVTATTADGRYPTRIELLHPSQVTWRQLPGDTLRFYVDNEERQRWPVGDLWHVPAYTMPGLAIGLSPIAYHAAKISGGLNAEKFGLDFFTAGGIPASILSVDGEKPTEDQAKTLKQRLLDITRGSREPLVLPASVKYEQISVNPTDSQFIETQRYTVEQICRIFREDPIDHGAAAGDKSSLTYQNRIDADLARLKRRQFWVTKLQNALTALLPRPQVVRLNTSAVLMMTPQERHALYATRLAARTQTINEVRTKEDEPTFGPEFDIPGIPPFPSMQGGAA